MWELLIVVPLIDANEMWSLSVDSDANGNIAIAVAVAVAAPGAGACDAFEKAK